MHGVGKGFWKAVVSYAVFTLAGLGVEGGVVYQNDFNLGKTSLAGLDQFGSGAVEVAGGHLALTPSVGAVGVTLDTSSLGAGYSTTLSANQGTVSWAFNV